jgi:Flp pilus assembly protein TadG
MHNRVRKIRLLRRLCRVRQLRELGRNERGIQLVELAIVLPIFLLLFAATAEFGRFFYEYSTLAKSTRAGTRYLISAPTNGSKDANAKNLVIYGNQTGSGNPVLPDIRTGNVTITRRSLGSGSQTVTVEIVGYKYQPLFDLGKMLNQPQLSLNIDVKPSLTMLHLPSV